jgi:hypothetical protein
MFRVGISPLILMMLLMVSCKEEDSANNENSEEVSTDSLNLFNSDQATFSNETYAADLVSSKDQSKLNLAQLNVQKLLTSCVTNEFSIAASLIMYRGTDQSRLGNDSFKYSNPNEANTVNVTCEVINNWLGSSKSYDFISYKEEPSEYGPQYIVEVLFSKQKIGIERHFFYLMDSPKGLILVNMI